MTKMKKVSLTSIEDLTPMELDIDTDIGGYAYYSFYYVARSNFRQAAGEITINDNGTSVSFDIRSTVAPDSITLADIITIDVQYVNGRRVVLYTAPYNLEFFYMKNKSFG